MCGGTGASCLGPIPLHGGTNTNVVVTPCIGVWTVQPPIQNECLVDVPVTVASFVAVCVWEGGSSTRLGWTKNCGQPNVPFWLNSAMRISFGWGFRERSVFSSKGVFGISTGNTLGDEVTSGPATRWHTQRP